MAADPRGPGRPEPDSEDAPWWDDLDGGTPGGGPPPPPPRGPDLSALAMVAEGIRAALPRELQAQFTAFLRELLLALRALIDWYLERLDRRQGPPPAEDIPID